MSELQPGDHAIDKVINSESNATFMNWRDCLTSKGIKKHGEFLVAGERAIRETLERFPALVRSLILCLDRHVPVSEGGNAKATSQVGTWMTLVSRARDLAAENDPRFTAIALARPLFDQLDISGTHAPILLLNVPEMEDVDLFSEPEGLEIICALGDPANVGALLRSAAAFGASKVILARESASPFNAKAVRAASAATLTTPLARGPSIRELPALFEEARLKSKIVALDMNGKDLHTYKWPKNVRILIGEEGQGVPASSAFEYVSIPIAPDVESLNATVAASIALYSYQASQK